MVLDGIFVLNIVFTFLTAANRQPLTDESNLGAIFKDNAIKYAK